MLRFVGFFVWYSFLKLLFDRDDLFRSAVAGRGGFPFLEKRILSSNRVYTARLCFE